MPTAESLSRADLESHDPRGGRGGREKRYRCPLPGCEGDKGRNLSVNAEGVWTCYKCGESGRLIEDRAPRETKPWDKRARSDDFTRRMSGHASTAAPRPPRPTPEPDPKAGGYDFGTEMRAVVKIEGTEAAAYLASRGVPAGIAHACGVRFSPSFGCGRWWPEGEGRRWGKGRPAVVFPLRDQAGSLSGVSGRAPSKDGYLFQDEGGKPVNKQTRKVDPEGYAGIFPAPPDALNGTAVAVTEAPIDALSLCLCGLPTVATVGTGCPEWLVERLAFRTVFLAHDDDAPDSRGVRAGDAAAERIAAEVRAIGGRPVRLRPPSGSKDWNDALQRFGRTALAAAVARAVAPYLLPGPPSAEEATVQPTSEATEQEPQEPAQEAQETAFTLPIHTKHAEGIQAATERRVAPRRVKAQQWPAIGSPVYRAMPPADKEEACAFFDNQGAYELHKLLDYKAAGYDSPAERMADQRRIDELVAWIEKQAEDEERR